MALTPFRITLTAIPAQDNFIYPSGPEGNRIKSRGTRG